MPAGASGRGPERETRIMPVSRPRPRPACSAATAFRPASASPGVSTSVSTVAKVRPPAMARRVPSTTASTARHRRCVRSKKSMLTPITIGISPSTVVIEVRNTGRRRWAPVRSARLERRLPVPLAGRCRCRSARCCCSPRCPASAITPMPPITTPNGRPVTSRPKSTPGDREHDRRHHHEGLVEAVELGHQDHEHQADRGDEGAGQEDHRLPLVLAPRRRSDQSTPAGRSHCLERLRSASIWSLTSKPRRDVRLDGHDPALVDALDRAGARRRLEGDEVARSAPAPPRSAPAGSAAPPACGRSAGKRTRMSTVALGIVGPVVGTVDALGQQLHRLPEQRHVGAEARGLGRGRRVQPPFDAGQRARVGDVGEAADRAPSRRGPRRPPRPARRRSREQI